MTTDGKIKAGSPGTESPGTESPGRGTALRLGIAAAILFLVSAVGSYFYYQHLLAPVAIGNSGNNPETSIIFHVSQGEPFIKIANRLEDKDLIKNALAFRILGRQQDATTSLQTGEYKLSPRMSSFEILKILRQGRVVLHSITIPEGLRLDEIAVLIEKAAFAKKADVINAAKDPELLALAGSPPTGIEGYLFPDTYSFAAGTSAKKILETMVTRFNEVMKNISADNSPRSDWSKTASRHEIVTLAAIIEKETGSAPERPHIASVFLNRLERDMMLQTDPTVIYGIIASGREFDGNIKLAHLKENTPYNTYVISGLPPGPICNPGEDALKAVFYPLETKDLYFVSKNNGTHYFSETFAEHDQAVNYYQRKIGRPPSRPER